jgi:hypothetical protein
MYKEDNTCQVVSLTTLPRIEKNTYTITEAFTNPP